MRTTIKSTEVNNYYVELSTEDRNGYPVYIAGLYKTYDGELYTTVKESTTGDRKNATVTYRRYLKQVTI